MEDSIKTLVTVLLLVLTITQSSCSKDDDNPNSQCVNTVCTEQFVTISVSIADRDQKPVVLDSFSVTNIENGKDMTVSLSESELDFAKKTGKYPLTDDSSLSTNQQAKLLFRGLANNEELISSQYVVGTDCCHINLISGDLELELISIK